MTLKTNFLFVLIALSVAPTTALARRGGFDRAWLSLEAGGVLTNIAKTSGSNDSSATLFGTPQTLIGLSAKIGYFRPEVDYTLLGRGGETHSSQLLVFQVPYLIPSAFDADWKIGFSLWMQLLSGSGGTILLNDGTSTGVAFSKPGRSETTRLLGVFIGYTRPITSELAVDLDLHVLGIASARRSFNLVAQLAWSFL